MTPPSPNPPTKTTPTAAVSSRRRIRWADDHGETLNKFHLLDSCHCDALAERKVAARRARTAAAIASRRPTLRTVQTAWQAIALAESVHHLVVSDRDASKRSAAAKNVAIADAHAAVLDLSKTVLTATVQDLRPRASEPLSIGLIFERDTLMEKLDQLLETVDPTTRQVQTTAADVIELVASAVRLVAADRDAIQRDDAAKKNAAIAGAHAVIVALAKTMLLATLHDLRSRKSSTRSLSVLTTRFNLFEQLDQAKRDQVKIEAPLFETLDDIHYNQQFQDASTASVTVASVEKDPSSLAEPEGEPQAEQAVKPEAEIELKDEEEEEDDRKARVEARLEGERRVAVEATLEDDLVAQVARMRDRDELTIQQLASTNEFAAYAVYQVAAARDVVREMTEIEPAQYEGLRKQLEAASTCDACIRYTKEDHLHTCWPATCDQDLGDEDHDKGQGNRRAMKIHPEQATNDCDENSLHQVDSVLHCAGLKRIETPATGNDQVFSLLEAATHQSLGKLIDDEASEAQSSSSTSSSVSSSDTEVTTLEIMEYAAWRLKHSVRMSAALTLTDEYGRDAVIRCLADAKRKIHGDDYKANLVEWYDYLGEFAKSESDVNTVIPSSACGSVGTLQEACKVLGRPIHVVQPGADGYVSYQRWAPTRQRASLSSSPTDTPIYLTTKTDRFGTSAVSWYRSLLHDMTEASAKDARALAPIVVVLANERYYGVVVDSVVDAGVAAASSVPSLHGHPATSEKPQAEPRDQANTPAQVVHAPAPTPAHAAAQEPEQHPVLIQAPIHHHAPAQVQTAVESRAPLADPEPAPEPALAHDPVQKAPPRDCVKTNCTNWCRCSTRTAISESIRPLQPHLSAPPPLRTMEAVSIEPSHSSYAVQAR